MMNGPHLLIITFTCLLKEASNMQTAWIKMRQKERKKGNQSADGGRNSEAEWDERNSKRSWKNEECNGSLDYFSCF